MFYRFIYFVFTIFPNLKQFFWKRWYVLFANKVTDSELRFMNYGYSSIDLCLSLKSEDEKDRFPIQLYHHVASQIDLKDLQVLEIGSGRGGGCSYITRYLKPNQMTGLDISSSAIKLCESIYDIDNLNFMQGNAEDLPFNDASFDAVINIESSHCYASMSQFLREVSRVLKPNGYFLFCDLRRDVYIQDMLNHLNSNGLSLISHTDISSNIITATSEMSGQRKQSIEKLKTGFFKNILESFAAVEGSKVHKSFTNGYLKYISAVCIKKS